MSSDNAKRLGIVASLVTIIGAIYWWLKGGDRAVQLLSVSAQPSGDVTPYGATSQFVAPAAVGGTPITIDTKGSTYDNSTSIQNIYSMPQVVPNVTTSTSNNAAGYPGVTNVTNNYPQNGPGNYLTPSLNYNLPPALDMPKFMKQQSDAVNASITSNMPGGCGCSGSNGVEGSYQQKCSNTANPAFFVDGTGNCMSSTVGRLSKTIDNCSSGFDAMKDNMESAVPQVYAGINHTIYGELSQNGLQLSAADSLYTPPFSFTNWIQ
jgi:hypothetical protein